MPHRISSAARRTSACSFDDLFKTPTSTKNLELEEDGIGVRLRAQRSTSDALLAASQDLLASSTSSQAHSSSTGNLPSPSSSDSAVESGSAFAHRLSQFSLPLVGKLVLPQVVLPKRLDGDVNRRSPKDINDRATRSSPSSSTMPAALPEPP